MFADRARKKLFSAPFRLEAHGRLEALILGVARSDGGDERFRRHARSTVAATVPIAGPLVADRLVRRSTLVGGDCTNEETFCSLDEHSDQTPAP